MTKRCKSFHAVDSQSVVPPSIELKYILVWLTIEGEGTAAIEGEGVESDGDGLSVEFSAGEGGSVGEGLSAKEGEGCSGGTQLTTYANRENHN